MVLSIPLIISLSFTLVIGILLFLYIRQKTSSVDMKVNTLMQFIQDEATKREAIQASQQQSLQHLANTTEQEDITNVEKEGGSDIRYEENYIANYLEKIEVSDDDNQDDESEFDSDSDSLTDDDESSVDDTELLEEDDIDNDSIDDETTTIHLEEINVVSTNNLENELNNESHESIPDIKTIQLNAENNNQTEEIASITNQIENLANEIATSSIDDITNNLGNNNLNGEEESLQVNLKSLKVSKLRELAIEKNLVENSDNVKKMKKNELLEILGS